MKLTHRIVSPLRVLFSVSLIGCTLSAATSRPPNILHINADDFRADGLHSLGTEILQTPNLDLLVANGTTFSHCYTQGSMIGAVCQPSRTMLLTGRSWLRIPTGREPRIENLPVLPSVLGAAGYETFHVGKSGNEFLAGINRFDTNLVMDDRTDELRRTSSARHAEAAIKFLKERKTGGKPFYIYFAPPVPHDPRVAEPQFEKLYDAAKIPLPAAFLPQHPWDNDEMAVRDELLAPWPRTPANTKKQIAEYYACITGLDYYVGQIFAQLKASGEWDNTIIIFTGDNGLSLGEHGLFGKQNLYEFGGMHVPCVVFGPGIPKGKSDALVYLMDLFPTFCDLVGAPIPAGIEGRSLEPVLHGRADKVRDVLYTAYRAGQRSVRDQRWKLIRYPIVDRTQLFDLDADPRELNNLAYEPAYADRVSKMTVLLQQEMTRYADTAPLVVANPKPAAWTPPAATAKEGQP
jgi:arylsulfatase A-like enzyme